MFPDFINENMVWLTKQKQEKLALKWKDLSSCCFFLLQLGGLRYTYYSIIQLVYVLNPVLGASHRLLEIMIVKEMEVF